MTHFAVGQLVRQGHKSSLIGKVVNVDEGENPEYYIKWDDGTTSFHRARELVKASISGPRFYTEWS